MANVAQSPLHWHRRLFVLSSPARCLAEGEKDKNKTRQNNKKKLTVGAHDHKLCRKSLAKCPEHRRHSINTSDLNGKLIQWFGVLF